jgi:hypothetical protein
MTWASFAAAAPDLAADGARLIDRTEGEVLLATVRGDDPPRIHPVTVAIVDGRLCTFILPSAKLRDLEADGRYALHVEPDPAAPREFSVRGRARRIDDPAIRGPIAARWDFTPTDDYRLFELDVESALLGVRNSPDEWPPRYTRWSATA